MLFFNKPLGYLRFTVPSLHGERSGLAQLEGKASAAERQLREAQWLFAKMGAPGQTERLGEELPTLTTE